MRDFGAPVLFRPWWFYAAVAFAFLGIVAMVVGLFYGLTATGSDYYIETPVDPGAPLRRGLP